MSVPSNSPNLYWCRPVEPAWCLMAPHQIGVELDSSWTRTPHESDGESQHLACKGVVSLGKHLCASAKQQGQCWFPICMLSSIHCALTAQPTNSGHCFWFPLLSTCISTPIVYTSCLHFLSHALMVVLQLVAKWRAISSAARSEGVINHYQAIRQKASRKVTHHSVAPAKPIRPASKELIVRTQDLVSKLYENGYIKPKMIRIRLLHYWICRLLGAFPLYTQHSYALVPSFNKKGACKPAYELAYACNNQR